MTETPQAPADAMAEAMDLIDAAEREGITVRLLGGMAVRVLCPQYPPRPSTGLQDIDLASVTPSRKALQNFLIAQGHQLTRTSSLCTGISSSTASLRSAAGRSMC